MYDKYKNKDKRKKYLTKYYIKNKELILKKNSVRRKKNKKRYSEKQKEWYLRNCIKIKDRREQVRNLILEHYGKQCNCCGESNRRFLTIDHINNDGAQERRKLFGSTGGTSYRTDLFIIKNNYPDTYQILCYNCNCGKERNNGICPHVND